MKRRILVNRIKCNSCGDIITSRTRHDYIACKCGKVFTDGGNDYLHRSRDGYNSLDVYSDAPFELIRESFERGGRGKDGKSPLTFVPLKDMSNSWIEATIDYLSKINSNENYDYFIIEIYGKELNYRKAKNIFIKDSD